MGISWSVFKQAALRKLTRNTAVEVPGNKEMQDKLEKLREKSEIMI